MPPFTPGVQTYYAFREALRELLEEGVDARIEHYRIIARELRTGLQNIGLSLYIPEAVMSNTMTTIHMPAGWSYDVLHEQCRQQGYVIYKS
jgi:aspartate aminotransferase-like enzyme